MKPLLFAIVGLAAGAAITIQSSLSGQLSRRLANPIVATSSVYLVGFLLASLYLLLSPQRRPSIAQLSSTPLHLWIAGGAISIAALSSVYWIMPKLGAAPTLLWVICGQLLCAAFVSHFSLFELPGNSLNTTKLIGLALAFAGAILFNLSHDPSHA